MRRLMSLRGDAHAGAERWPYRFEPPRMACPQVIASSIVAPSDMQPGEFGNSIR